MCFWNVVIIITIYFMTSSIRRHFLFSFLWILTAAVTSYPLVLLLLFFMQIQYNDVSIYLSLCSFDDALSFSSSNRRNSITTFRRTQLVMRSIARASACCVKCEFVVVCMYVSWSQRERRTDAFHVSYLLYRDKRVIYSKESLERDTNVLTSSSVII